MCAIMIKKDEIKISYNTGNILEYTVDYHDIIYVVDYIKISKLL